jgi:hypothetical protein
LPRRFTVSTPPLLTYPKPHTSPRTHHPPSRSESDDDAVQAGGTETPETDAHALAHALAHGASPDSLALALALAHADAELAELESDAEADAHAHARAHGRGLCVALNDAHWSDLHV